MRAHSTSLFVLLASLMIASRGLAQRPTASLQAGVTPVDGESLFELGARFSPRGTFGADFSIDVYPRYIFADALAGVVDLSLTANVRLGPVVTIAPRAGVGILGAVGNGGAAALPGFSGGVGLVFAIDSRTTLRVDYTYRRLKEGDETYPVPSLTAGFVIKR